MVSVSKKAVTSLRNSRSEVILPLIGGFVTGLADGSNRRVTITDAKQLEAHGINERAVSLTELITVG